jgi:hypothetical protein
MVKGNISVFIEAEIIEQAREKKINISRAAEEGIAAALGQEIIRPRKKSKVDDLLESGNQKLEEMVIRVMEDPSRGIGNTVKLIKRMLGIQLSLEETQEYFQRLKEKGVVAEEIKGKGED